MLDVLFASPLNERPWFKNEQFSVHDSMIDRCLTLKVCKDSGPILAYPQVTKVQVARIARPHFTLNRSWELHNFNKWPWWLALHPFDPPFSDFLWEQGPPMLFRCWRETLQMKILRALAFCPNLLLLFGLRTLLSRWRYDSWVWVACYRQLHGKSRFQLPCIGLCKPSTNIPLPFGFVPCIFDPESFSIDSSD